MLLRFLVRESAGDGRTRLRAEIYELGRDLVVILGGGEIHLGSATLADPLPAGRSRTSSVTGEGHRESELSIRLSEAILAATGRRTVTLAGVHLDEITQDEIEQIRENTAALALRLQRSLGNS
jgi:hypothetical protein